MQNVNTLEREELLRVFEVIMEHSFESVIITDAIPNSHKIIYANAQFCRMTGYTKEELYGKNPRIFQGKNTKASVIQRLKLALQQGDSFEGATINYRKDGSEYPVQWNVYPVRNEHNEIQYFVSVQRDLTAFRQSLNRLKVSSKFFKLFLSELLSKNGASNELETAKAELDKNVELLSAYSSKVSSSEEQTSDFFDFDTTSSRHNISVENKRTLSAAAFIGSAEIDPAWISELKDIAGLLAVTISTDDLTNYDEVDRKKLINDLQEFANAVFYIEEFIDISINLSELSAAMYHSIEIPFDVIVTQAIKGLIDDLYEWVYAVFVEQTAEDIHWLDSSIISSCKQIAIFTRLDGTSDEDDELF
ncbi:PAS domain-containing protein [Alteromonas facilis]|uniref:PAS domain-containing protein n=1 Tax=Alteromonas facilis TaxID=2048004 RepID=UPI000C292CD9|nr:PAS domain-containing protein [Alteromonas facilis]